MLVYSKKIIQFIEEIKRSIKEILSKDLGLTLREDFFSNPERNCFYRISVVIYNDRNMLGYFDPNLYELGFHERLMYVNKNQLHNIIRHELAHYLIFIRYAYPVAAHGVEFRHFCRQVGWGEDVYNATIDLNDNLNEKNIEESDVFRKVQKLMALSTSSNQNEAEAAMIKSQQLLLKHNIESSYIHKDNDEKVFLKRIMEQTQITMKMRAIASILSAFFVTIVFIRKKNGVHLEIAGSAVNIQIAEYVANILENKFEDLWNQTKKKHKLKGKTAKNSFFEGIAMGYLDKINAFKKSYYTDVSNALMVIEKQLQEVKSMIYKDLTSLRSQISYCEESALLGELAGKQLDINPGIGSSAKHSEALIAYDN